MGNQSLREPSASPSVGRPSGAPSGAPSVGRPSGAPSVDIDGGYFSMASGSVGDDSEYSAFEQAEPYPKL